jgi:hypothetical protein
MLITRRTPRREVLVRDQAGVIASTVDLTLNQNVAEKIHLTPVMQDATTYHRYELECTDPSVYEPVGRELDRSPTGCERNERWEKKTRVERCILDGSDTKIVGTLQGNRQRTVTGAT